MPSWKTTKGFCTESLRLWSLKFLMGKNTILLVSRICSNQIEMYTSWATPPQHYQIQRLKPLSSVIETEYKLTMYDRTIQACIHLLCERRIFLNIFSYSYQMFHRPHIHYFCVSLKLLSLKVSP